MRFTKSVLRYMFNAAHVQAGKTFDQSLSTDVDHITGQKYNQGLQRGYQALKSEVDKLEKILLEMIEE
jgi:hypothetical protein